MDLKRKIPYITGLLLVSVLFVVTSENGFFWDTVQLGSEHAAFFLSTDFARLLLPDSIDSGHIPAFGFYLGLAWKLFGRSLLVSHIAMLPFVAGILWQLSRLVGRFIPQKYSGWAFLMILADPTVLSQMTLMSPDVPLMFFFLMGVNAVLENKRTRLSAAVAFLFLTSMRGMMVATALFAADITKNIFMTDRPGHRIQLFLKRLVIYLPAILIFLSYNGYHFLVKGWIGFHKDSPWATLFERVPLSGMAYNAGIIVWRLVDFGRAGIWILFLYLLLRYGRKIFRNDDIRFQLYLFLLVTALLSLSMVWAKNLLCHRYLLPAYISFSLLSATILFTSDAGRGFKTAGIAFWMVMLLAGNFWVYPEKIATGWDATLAHLPYYSLRKEAIDYLDKKSIDFNGVQSFFPDISSIDDFDLNGDHRKFSDFDNTSRYVLYSNVFNISDADYDIVKKDFSVVRHFRKGLVYVDVCRRNTDLPAGITHLPGD